MIATSDTRLAGLTGRALAIQPSVRVSDAEGAPVAAVLVSFDPDPGHGTVGSRVAQTGGDGVARVTWTLGEQIGTQRLRARATGLPTVTFEAIVTSGPASFDIEIRLDPTTGSPSQRAAFAAAEARWEKVLTGELPDIHITGSPGFCGLTAAVDEVVDDLVIIAEIVDIDGPGGVLGSAGPCLIRSGSDLPVLGRMRFDIDDLARLEATGTLDEVIAHEMGHVLGIGSLWELFGLLADTTRPDSTRADPHFVGLETVSAFERIGGAGYPGSRVPVEDTGGPGTHLSHWRETVFADELMTGFINRGSNPLSAVTVASLHDMGYQVDGNAAETYRLPPPSRVSASRVPDPTGLIVMGDDILAQPIFTVDPSGVVRPSDPRR